MLPIVALHNRAVNAPDHIGTFQSEAESVRAPATGEKIAEESSFFIKKNFSFSINAINL